MGPTVFTLTPERASRTQIVVPDSPSPTQTGAAELLAEHLGSLLGADLPIVGVDAPSLDGEILIGPSSRTRQLGVDIDVDSLGEDGFLLRTVAGRLVIIGGSEKGAVYGAATFLEEHLGFRFYAADAFVAPDVDRFEIPDGLDITWIPPIEFREDFYRGVWDPAYQEWHKLDRHVEEWEIGRASCRERV